MNVRTILDSAPLTYHRINRFDDLTRLTILTRSVAETIDPRTETGPRAHHARQAISFIRAWCAANSGIPEDVYRDQFAIAVGIIASSIASREPTCTQLASCAIEHLGDASRSLSVARHAGLSLSLKWVAACIALFDTADTKAASSADMPEIVHLTEEQRANSRRQCPQPPNV